MKAFTRRMSRLIIGAGLALVASGCLELKKQSAFIKVDEKNERLTILLVHEGFYVRPCKPRERAKALADAKESLAEFARSDRTIWLFGGLFGRLDLDPQPEDDETVAGIKRRFAGLFEVKPGVFLKNDRGELGGYQTIVVPDAKALIKVLNELLSENVRRDGPGIPWGTPPFTRESLGRMKEAAEAGHAWLRLANGRIVFDLPMTPADAETILARKDTDPAIRDYFEQIRKSLGAFRVSPSEAGLAFALGDEESRVVTWTISDKRDAKVLFERELLEYAQGLPGVFDKAQDVQAVIRKFVSTP